MRIYPTLQGRAWVGFDYIGRVYVYVQTKNDTLNKWQMFGEDGVELFCQLDRQHGGITDNSHK